MGRVQEHNTKIDVSFKGLDVGISGAIPERESWTERAMDRGILEFVALFTGLIFKYGGRVVHGCHPSFTPIILRQARLHATWTDRLPVTLVMSDLWFSGYLDDEISAMTDIAELLVTKKMGTGTDADAQTRNASLTAMREVLVASQNMMVSVGGKLHSKDGINPGVAEEMALAEQNKIPRYLIGGLGGFSQKLAAELMPSSLNNSLSWEENVKLFGTDDVSSCVNILFEHLCQRYWTYKSIHLPPTTLSAVRGFIHTTISPDNKVKKPRGPSF
ncbi:hypothetical protein [Serratia fonticola]|uniref:hypothetical protein n=1 Tax=Serratia fonticola TaxID=47917 RepID=UPI002178D863|nr:hypothetical protein [Serratia fonticola]CAI1661410.1 Uncharacterised protein [Serratia fonticola]